MLVHHSFLPSFHNRRGWVPTFPVTTDWSSPTPNGEMKSHSRTMLPIRLCYAWTVWKSQGQTIPGKVVISLGEKEREHGLTYTAFSRVKKMSNLGILGGMSYARLTKSIRNHVRMPLRVKEEKRLHVLSKATMKFLDDI